MGHIAWHRNGGASIVGTESHVSHDSFCDSDSVIVDSVVVGSSLISSRVDHCIIAPLFGYAPSLFGVELYNVVVEGDAQLIGPWTLMGKQAEARIPTGRWERPPRYMVISGESAVEGHDVLCGVTESTDGHALIACMRKPLTKWLKFGPRLGRILGWTPAQVKQAADFFTMLLDTPNG